MSTLDLEGKKTILFHKLKIYINMNKFKSLKFVKIIKLNLAKMEMEYL